MKIVNVLLAILLTAIMLSGCLYPEERKAKNSAPHQHQLKEVQAAVDEFREATGGLLPIKTRDMGVPIYQKYPIDFNRLSPGIWLSRRAHPMKTAESTCTFLSMWKKADGQAH